MNKSLLIIALFCCIPVAKATAQDDSTEQATSRSFLAEITSTYLGSDTQQGYNTLGYLSGNIGVEVFPFLDVHASYQYALTGSSEPKQPKGYTEVTPSGDKKYDYYIPRYDLNLKMQGWGMSIHLHTNQIKHTGFFLEAGGSFNEFKIEGAEQQNTYLPDVYYTSWALHSSAGVNFYITDKVKLPLYFKGKYFFRESPYSSSDIMFGLGTGIRYRFRY